MGRSSTLPAPVLARDDDPNALHRARLVQHLSGVAGAAPRLVLAPAGYGKSTAVRQWASCGPVLVERLRADDDPWRVARRLAARIAVAFPDLDVTTAGRLHDGLATHDRHVLDRAFDALTTLAPCALVLECFDAPTDPELVEDLCRLLARPASGVHVVAVARASRSRQVAELLRRDVGRVGPEDLAFSAAETAELVLQVSGRELGAEDVEDLMQRTDGWPVAIQLAAVALRNQRPAAEVIAGISGENPHIAAFLGAEVLDGLSPRIRRFLVRTAPLDPLVVGACDAATGEGASGVVLRLLEQHGVPLRPSAHRPGGLAYHPMLREHLRRELQGSSLTAEADVLRAAAAWHATHDDLAASIRYLVEAEDWRAVLAVADRAGPTAIATGRAASILEWLDQVPVAHGGGAPLLLREALLQSILGHSPLGEQLLRDAERHTLTAGEQTVLHAVRASTAFVQTGHASTVDAADLALARIDRLEHAEVPNLLGITTRADVHAMASGARGRALWLAGDGARGRWWLVQSLAQPGAAGIWRAQTHSTLAVLEAWAGNLKLASWHVHDAKRAIGARADERHPVVTKALLARAHVFLERGELRRARATLHEAHPDIVRMRRPTALAVYAIELARWYLAAGKPEDGLEVLRRHYAFDEPALAQAFERQLLAVEARLALAAHGPDAAADVVATFPETRPIELSGVAVQVAMALGDLDAARGELDRWPTSEGYPRGRLEQGILHALLELESGHRQLALALAEGIIEEGGKEGHVRLFLDLGRPMTVLLRALLHQGPSPHARHLIKLLSTRPDLPTVDTAGLSERELEVVRYLPTPLSNAEIAAHLFVSLNTLKTHLRAIYRKLDVQGRRDAIARAESLGIA